MFWLLPEEYMLKFGRDGSCGSGTFEADPTTVIDSVRLSSSSTEFLFTEADIVNCADAGEAAASNRSKGRQRQATASDRKQLQATASNGFL